MNKDVERFMVVGEVRAALNKLSGVMGVDYGLAIPTEKDREAYSKLEDEYAAFYELPIQERLYVSGMATRPEEKK